MNKLLFILLGTMWGGAFFGIKIAVTVFPPFFSASMRVVLGTALAYLFMRLKGQQLPKERRVWLTYLGLGMLGMGIPWSFLFWAQQHVPAALSGIINSSVPIWVIILVPFLLKGRESLSKLKIAGVLCGFAGIVAIFAPALGAFDSGGRLQLFAMLALIGMAISYATQTVCFRRLATPVPGLVNVTMQGISGFVFLFTISMLFEVPALRQVDPTQVMRGVAALLYLGIFCTLFGWLIFFHLINNIGAVRAGAVTYVVPVIAVTLDWLYLGVLPSTNEFLGAGLIFFGLIFINLEKRLSPPSAAPIVADVEKRVA